MSLTVRPMSGVSFAAWNERLVVEYAREKVEAGLWAEAHALDLELTSMHMMNRIAPA